jgi:hypothetical protein
MRGRGKGDNLAQVGWTLKAQEEETHILPGYRVVGTGLGVPPEENPKILAVAGLTIQAPAELVPTFPFCPFTNICITGKFSIEGFPV